MELILLIIIISLSIVVYRYVKKDGSVNPAEWDFLEENITANLPGPGTYSFDIVGESRYQKALEDICGGHDEDGVNQIVQAILIHEDDNPYDNQAIRVDVQGMTVGYLRREDAREFRRQLREAGHPGIVATCSAKIVGGWDRGRGDRGHFGVKLDLPVKAPVIEKELLKNTDGEVVNFEFYVDEINSSELKGCAVGDFVNLWKAPEASRILIYRRGTVGGAGKIGSVPAEYFGVIAPCFIDESNLRYDAHITDLGLNKCKISCKLYPEGEFVPDRKARETDGVFYTWTPSDLDAMLSQLNEKTNFVDRHFLLMNIVGETYKHRDDPEMRDICHHVAQMHIDEFHKIKPYLKRSIGVLPRVPTFQQYATVLTEEERFEEAIAVCETAMKFGLSDGTKRDFAGRIERIKKKEAKSMKRKISKEQNAVDQG
jgi:hypothetical protein